MKAVRILSLITLGFLGVTSLMGGIPLILAPSGRLLHMPLSLLAHSPFHDFLIPGVLLTMCNGLLSLVIFWATLRRRSGYGNLVGLQGFVIGGWITVEVILLQSAMWAHYVYWGVGLVLIVCGIILRRDRRVARPTLAAAH
jgi:hypothetical protein